MHPGTTTPPASRSSRILAWSFLLVAVVLVVGIRSRLLATPLERDEGEYAYMGQTILDGIPPYQDAGNLKLPGIYLAYAGMMAAFGQTAAGIHLGILIVNLASLALLLAIARRFLDLGGAVIATAAFGFLALSPAYLGLAGHATHFVALFVLAGLWCLLRVEQRGGNWGCFAAGLSFGMAFLMKQPGLFFGIFGGLYLLWFSRAGRVPGRGLAVRLTTYTAGTMLPYALVCGWLAWAGVFSRFWYWTVTYAGQYSSTLSLAGVLQNARSQGGNMFVSTPMFWGLAAAGIACLVGAGRRERIFFGGFLLAGICAAAPGGYFRNHYFIPFLPAVSLVAGLAVTRIDPRLARRTGKPAPLFFLLAATLCTLCLFGPARPVFFRFSPADASRAVYGNNPFPEAPVIGAFLAKHTRPDQRILVLGDEPEICFYAHRRLATSRLYPSQLMDPRPFTEDLQEKYIREAEAASPAYAIWVSERMSWMMQDDSHKRLFEWAGNYLSENFQPVGAAQMRDGEPTLWVWGHAVTNIPAGSPETLIVYQRINRGAASTTRP